MSILEKKAALIAEAVQKQDVIRAIAEFQRFKRITSSTASKINEIIAGGSFETVDLEIQIVLGAIKVIVDDTKIALDDQSVLDILGE